MGSCGAFLGRVYVANGEQVIIPIPRAFESIQDWIEQPFSNRLVSK